MICAENVSCQTEAKEGRKRCERHLALARARVKRWEVANPDRAHAIKKASWVRRGQHVRAEQGWLSRYGLTKDDYNAMMARQCGLCAICAKPETVFGNHGQIKRLAVDHDHESGKVRGLLCNNCNRALGLLKDDLKMLDRARNYLIRTAG